MHPDAVNLPFNRESLQGRFVPAKSCDVPAVQQGHWLLIQNQALLVTDDGQGIAGKLPAGALPPAFDAKAAHIVHLGNYEGVPCWAASVGSECQMPAGFRPESLLPAQTRLPVDVLSLGGLALQAIHWEMTSRYCPRCGEPTVPINGERGKRCPRCAYEHYPHLHPAVIVLVRDGERVLLTRKSFWAKGRYGLVAGFVDSGESLEGAAHREVGEEVGVQIRDLTYIASQYWPFPSQLMVGFMAVYAGGEVRVDHEELEDAGWFSIHALPDLPPKFSIARFLLDHYARP
ncbi:MAG TPA: NAD(+) diphosphatase [Candidatus Methylomirabilis sp.]|nr:NAD(+) diphosphatase [Candidatus Methylomirabilis sp.]